MIDTQIRLRPVEKAKPCSFKLADEDFKLVCELAEKHYDGVRSILFRDAVKHFLPTLIDH